VMAVAGSITELARRFRFRVEGCLFTCTEPKNIISPDVNAGFVAAASGLEICSAILPR
jgi:hypothetical protein